MSLFKRKPTSDEPRQPTAVGLGRQRAVPNQTPSMGRGQVFSYHGNRSQTELNVGRETRSDQPQGVPRRLPSRLHKLRAHAGWLAGAVLILAAVVYQLQLTSTPRVVSLVSSREAPYLRDTKVYAAAASELMRTSAMNRNKLTVRTSAISEGLRQRFPELDTATVSLPLWGDTATVYIKPADPALLLATPSDTFIVDKRGRALQSVEGDSRSPQIPTVTDESNLTFQPGRQVLSRNVTMFIASVGSQFRAQRTEVQAMVLPAGTSELHVYPAGSRYFVKFNLHEASEDSARLQTGSYAAVRRYLDNKRLTPGQYIDVRLQGRVYFK